jgi:large subunit ribosomal protein L2
MMKTLYPSPRGLKVGETVLAAPNASILIGNCLPFQSIPLGTSVHNVELTPGCGGQLARAAGCVAQIVAKEFCNARRRS